MCMKNGQANDSLSDEHLDAYLANQAGEGEVAEVRAYLTESRVGVENALKHVSAVYAETDRAVTNASGLYDPQPLWNRVFSKLNASDTPSLGTNGRGSRDRKRTLWRGIVYGAVASGLMALLAIGTLSTWPGRESVYGRLSSTYATGNGENATITLPDGSVVQLNVASRVDVPADFAMGNRTIRLVGEAVFSVTHHSGSPFTVIAGPSTTRVLGTNFLVRFYPTDTIATVAVRDGKVAVASTILTASQQTSVSAYGVSAVRPMDPSVFAFEWETLVLKRTRLRDAIVELNRWYDADIRLTDLALGNEWIEGEFVKGSLSDLTEQFASSFGVKVVRDGKTVTLSRR